jgi:hypothetical protein
VGSKTRRDACRYNHGHTPSIRHPRLPRGDTRAPGGVCAWRWGRRIQGGVGITLAHHGAGGVDDRTVRSCWSRNLCRLHRCKAAPEPSVSAVPAAAGRCALASWGAYRAGAPTPVGGTKATTTGRARGRVATGSFTRTDPPGAPSDRPSHGGRPHAITMPICAAHVGAWMRRARIIARQEHRPRRAYMGQPACHPGARQRLGRPSALGRHAA